MGELVWGDMQRQQHGPTCLLAAESSVWRESKSRTPPTLCSTPVFHKSFAKKNEGAKEPLVGRILALSLMLSMDLPSICLFKIFPVAPFFPHKLLALLFKVSCIKGMSSVGIWAHPQEALSRTGDFWKVLLSCDQQQLTWEMSLEFWYGWFLILTSCKVSVKMIRKRYI